MNSPVSSSAPVSASVGSTRLPRIVVLGTGGTIAGSAPDASQTLGYQAGVIGIEQLLAQVPMLGTRVQIEAEQFANIDSKDMTDALWLALTRRINQVLARADVDGVVITHGTDTLEETAYWLHLTVDSAKPVVLTAAMRPATALSADGPSNLFNAVLLAAAPEAHGQGVLVAFGQRIHSAREVSKTSTYSIDAFASPELGVLGWIRDGVAQFERHAGRLHTEASEFALRDERLEVLPGVEIVVSHAGVSRLAVDAWVAGGVRGIVVAGTGNGSIHADLQQGLAAALAQGVAVVTASRVGAGPVVQGGGAAGEALGFVSAGMLNPYKARVLLMLALANGDVSHGRLGRIFEQY